MDSNYFDIILQKLSEGLTEHSFNVINGVYQNQTKAYKVEYDEAKKLFKLLVADVTEGNVGEFSEKSSWLFDENHTKADAECVAEDFVNTMLGELGVKKEVKRAAVDLPEKAQSGSNVTVSGLCSVLLSIYPQFKDDYKAHIEKYGELLSVTFLSATVAPAFHEQLVANNKKQLKKIIDTLCDTYINGDRTVCNLITEVVFLKAIGESKELLEVAVSYMENCPYLSTALKFLFARLKTDKNLRKVVLG